MLAYDRELVVQEQLRQKLIDEPLVEYQEQYSEDPVQPTTREDALALTDLLANSLPLGSIQVGCMHNLWLWWQCYITCGNTIAPAVFPPHLPACLDRDTRNCM